MENDRTLAAFAIDVGFLPYQLAKATARGPNAARELDAVLIALSLDVEVVRQAKAPTFAEMQFAWMACDIKWEFRRAIRSGTIGLDLDRICASANPIRVAALGDIADSHSRHKSSRLQEMACRSLVESAITFDH
jgi:hypothetical protein